MKLVIDIPDSLYANIRCIVNGSNACKRLLECVKEGKTLTENHGRRTKMACVFSFLFGLILGVIGGFVISIALGG